MQVTNVKIKAIFSNVDSRCRIQRAELATAIICDLSDPDGRRKTISGLRKSVMTFTNIKLSRSAFWDCMT